MIGTGAKVMTREHVTSRFRGFLTTRLKVPYLTQTMELLSNFSDSENVRYLI